jgi:D-glycero-alpha-D-manno-heptose 1-phosphate guanylyltransferase
MEAIILAGGFGTRLRSVVSDVPKPMAPVAGRPFLALLLEHLQRRGFTRVILAVGYMHEAITEYFSTRRPSLELCYSVEDRPLGTGGAVKLALAHATQENVFVLNGDSFVLVDYAEMLARHRAQGADMTIALASVAECSQFGTVCIDGDWRIRQFSEKAESGTGLVNAGVYLFRTSWVTSRWPQGSISLERDVLQPQIQASRAFGYLAAGDFIDIGTPESYRRVESFFQQVHG